MRRRAWWRIGVLAAAIAAFVAAAMARADGPARQATLPENTPFTEAPAGESAAIAALIERAGSALAAGRTPSDLLADPALLPAHEHPRFRKLIREKAQAAPLTLVTPIRTIRPASYPRSDLPAHVHVPLEPPHGGTTVITEIVFADDPLLTAPRRHEAEDVGFAVCTPQRGPDGTLAAMADFRLR